MVVSFPAGGTGDAVARVLADGLSARMKQTVVVDNQGGAAGTIGAAIVARAAPDGYTMLVSATSVFAVVPNMRKVDFDPIADLRPVARVGKSLRALAVSPKLPVKSVAELVAYAKKNPGKLNYGSAGPGSTVHILTESFRRAAGIDIVHIPYRGAAPALQGLLADDVEMLIDTVVIPHIKAGTVRGPGGGRPGRGSTNCRICRPWRKPAFRACGRRDGRRCSVPPSCRPNWSRSMPVMSRRCSTTKRSWRG